MLQVSARKKPGGGQGKSSPGKHFKNIASVTPRLTQVLQTHCIGTAQGPSNETELWKGNSFRTHYTGERGNSRLFFHKDMIDVCGL